MLRICFALVAAGLIVGPATSDAADWKRFRGPNGSAVSTATGLPTKWSDDSNLKWKTELPGPGTSSPIIVGDKVFLTCYSGYGTGGRGRGGSQTDLRRHIVCIDRKNGKKLWTKVVKPTLPEDYAGRMLATHGYASHTPATDGERLYVFLGKTGAQCYDLDGKLLWKKSLGTGSGIRGWGTASSPILYKDSVIYTAMAEGDAIVALEKKTGKEKWKTKVSGYKGTWSTPMILKTKERDELIISVPQEIWALNPETGKLLWYCDAIQQDAIAPSVVADDGIIYATGGRSSESVAIKAGGKGNISKTAVKWRARSGSYVASPVVYKGLMFVSSNRGTVYVYDAKTGETVKRTRLGARGQYYASPIVADGKLYIPTRGGAVVYSADKELKELAVNKFASDSTEFNASPAVANGELFLRSNKALYCIAKKKE